MKRLLAASTAALLLTTVLVSIPIAAEAAAKTGTASVKIGTPKNIPANVVLKKQHSAGAPRSAIKPGQGSSKTVSLSIAPGVYSVSVPTFVYRGVAYGGKASVSRVSIRAGKKASISAKITALPGSKSFTATDISTTTADLSWSAPKGSSVSLRRASGSAAPKTRSTGSRVAVTGHTAHVTGLQPGADYAYSLFTKLKGKWTGPLTLRSRTDAVGTSNNAAYVANPGTVFAKSSQISTVSMVGANLALSLKAGAPLLQSGSGVVVPANRALPAGYLGIVTGVASDGVTVQLRPAGLADVFQQYHLSTGDTTLGVDPTFPNGLSTSAVDAARVKQAESAASPGGAPVSTPTQNKRLDCSVDSGADVSFENALTFHRIVEMDIDKGKVKYNLGFSVTAKGALSVETTVSATCVADIFSGAQTIPASPVPLMVKWDISGSASVSGAMKVSNIGATATGGFGAKGTLTTKGFKATPYTISHAAQLTPVVSAENLAEVTLKLGGSVAFGVGTGSAAAGALVGLKGELYPLKATATLSRTPQNSTCTALKLGLEWKAALDAEAWFGPEGWWGSFEAESTKDLVGGEFPYMDTVHLPEGCDATGGNEPGTPPTDTPVTPPITDARTISSASTSPDLSCTLNTNEDLMGEYYSDTACGTFVAVNGTLYGPNDIPAAHLSFEPWTPMAQSNSGSGTAADPFRTVTRVTAGETGVQLVQTDSWVAGGSSVSTHVEVQNTTNTTQDVRLYHAIDCYTADDDTGTGGIDTASQTVGCVHVNDSDAVLSLRLTAITQGATIAEGLYRDVWSAIDLQGELNNSADVGGDYDNGEAVAWALTVPANSSREFEAVTAFAGPM